MTQAETIVAAGGATDATLALGLSVVLILSAVAFGYFLMGWLNAGND